MLKGNKKEAQKLLKWAKNEVKEWKQFIKVLEKIINRQKDE